MKSVATIILNRNLPDVTDRLYDHLIKFDGDQTDIYIVEAGSDKENLSKHTTWYADWPEARQYGLRYSRGMNFGLSQLWNEDKFKQYDSFFLLTNDTEFKQQSTLEPLINILNKHPKVGILSPCSERWGERLLLQTQTCKYFWFIHNNAYLMKRKFVESIMNFEQPDYMHFLFDGSNFRGYGSEVELIAKAYANDWASAITSEVFVSENESYLLNQSDLIKTENYEKNLTLYVEEGKRWMREKYGFNSRWLLQQHVKNFYNLFFDFHPEFKKFKL